MPCSTSRAVQSQMTLFNKRSEMILDGNAADNAGPHHRRVRDPAVLPDQFQDQHRKFGKRGNRDPFPFHLALKPFFLPLHRSQKQFQPRIPVGRICAERPLCPPMRQAATVLILLDHAFRRIAGHISVTGPAMAEAS